MIYEFKIFYYIFPKVSQKSFRKYKLMVQKNFKENWKEKQEPYKV